MRIAITGTGAVSPLGVGADVLCEALLAGEVGIRRLPWRPPEDPSLLGTLHDSFDPRDWMDERVIRGTDPFARIGLAATAQALRQAGLEDALDQLRTAVVVGTSIGGSHSLTHGQWAFDTKGAEAVDGKLMIQIWPNMAASQICMRYDLHGPSLTVTTACASSLDALGTAARFIEAGLADVAITGGIEGARDPASDPAYEPATSAAESSYGMSTPSVDPKRAMLPFDANRTGIVSGEGAAFLVLESEAHARARGAEVLGWVRGYGSLADGYHPSSPEPSGRWEARAMELAQADAGIAPADVDAVIAHATGTPKGDAAEILALNGVFVDGAGRDDLVVTGLKGNTGHTGASAGAMNILAGMWAMRHGRLPNVAGTTDLDPTVRFDVVLHEPRSVDLEVLQVNAFGFGGQDASVLVTRS
ncbi:MAG: beta-ketoacyl-[acyl-carrier-protein] synthase family protein [Acidimicrobiia bacterium]|nr:beta-ketoacyl-[acyl-carrier-protein] synthase family protein [Acidimicrobiia bacterium]